MTSKPLTLCKMTRAKKPLDKQEKEGRDNTTPGNFFAMFSTRSSDNTKTPCREHKRGNVRNIYITYPFKQIERV